MADIDIDDFVRNVETWNLTGSVATHGKDAAKETWAAAITQAEETTLLKTPEHLEAMRRWMRESGAWNKEERASKTDTELNALFMQLVTQDMRECGLEDSTPEDFDWDEYEANDAVSITLFLSDDGRVFYSLED